jgi:hypothetical protein
MVMQKRNIIFGLCVVAGVLGCEDRANNSGGSSGGSGPMRLIDTLGTHKFGDAEISVQIKSGSSIVEFDVRSLDGSFPEFSGTAGSNATRWFLYWTKDKTLWVRGDTGVYMWSRGEGAEYERHVLTPDSIQLIKQIPAPVFNALPTSLQDRWRSIRQTGGP